MNQQTPSHPPIVSLAKSFWISDVYELRPGDSQVEFGLAKPNLWRLALLGLVFLGIWVALVVASSRARPQDSVHVLVYMIGFGLTVAPIAFAYLRYRTLGRNRPSVRLCTGTRTVALHAGATQIPCGQIAAICDYTWQDPDGSVYSELQLLRECESGYKWELIGQQMRESTGQFQNAAIELATRIGVSHWSVDAC